MTVVSTQTAEHHTWGDACDGWHLLARQDLQVVREMVPPGRSGQRHCHATAQKFFFILAGQAVMELDGADYPLAAGERIHIPPGSAHQFKNPYPAAVEFLVISQPITRGDRCDLAGTFQRNRGALGLSAVG